MAVIVGYTESPPGVAALRAGIDEALRRASPLRIVHVTKVGARQDTYETMRSAEASLSEAASTARAAGVSEVAVDELRSASPISEALLEYIHGRAAEVLVIGIRRRSPMGKAVLGSVSQDLMLRADCAVLGVKATDDW
jgi:nucleotide-binding universal stress UspA family protein